MNRNELLQIIGKNPRPATVWVENDNQTLEAIQAGMLKKHEECKTDYDKIAPFFDRGTLEETALALWKFCKKNLRYVEETKEAQYLSSPQTLLSRGTSDCKGYALFVAGVLDALRRRGRNYNWQFRFSGYKPFTGELGHVFIVCGPGQKIWVDPVLGSFDYHKPYWLRQDITAKSRIPAKISGCGCDNEELEIVAVGSIVSTAGTLIAASAPALQAIPLVGNYVAAGAQLVGLFAQVFGKDYATSERVRWLTYIYQKNVLGNNITYSQVNENLTAESHTWFDAVFGVPVYDDLRYHTLTGTSTSNGAKLYPFPDSTTRANQYLQYWDAKQAGITFEQAKAAADIGTNFPLPFEVTGKLGGWKMIPQAPATIARIQAEQAAAQAGHQPADLRTATDGSNNWIWIAAAGVGVYLLTKNKKRRRA